MVGVQRALLTVDIDREVRRVEFTYANEQEIVRLRCPYSRQPCSANCAAIALWQNDQDLGLVCKAFHKPIMLGFLDPQTVDFNLVEILKSGSELQTKEARK